LLKNQFYKQGFEVEDIGTRKNFSFVYDPFSQAVIGYDTSINTYPSNKQIFKYTKSFPFEKETAYEYFLYLHEKATKFESDNNTYIIGWINPYNFQPIEPVYDDEDIVEESWEANLKSKLSMKHKEFINLIESDEIKDIINKNCYIAGGSLSSIIRDEKPKDIDYFVSNKEALDAIQEYFKKRYEISQMYQRENHRPITLLNGYDDVPMFYTDRAISLCEDFQIILKDYGDPEEVCSRFDYVHCMGYYFPSNNELNVTLDTKISAERKILIYNITSTTPITSAYRMAKLIESGWKIQKHEQSKLLININKYQFNDGEMDNVEDASHYDF
jgi:hypothetical protein